MKIDLHPSGKFATTLEEIHVVVGDIHVTVPKGFETDGASLPRLLWWYCPPFKGRHTRGAVVHDYLYATGEQPRKVSDKIFLAIMGEDGVRKRKRRIMYMGVRSCGWKAYRAHKARRKRELATSGGM